MCANDVRNTFQCSEFTVGIKGNKVRDSSTGRKYRSVRFRRGPIMNCALQIRLALLEELKSLTFKELRKPF